MIAFYTTGQKRAIERVVSRQRQNLTELTSEPGAVDQSSSCEGASFQQLSIPRKGDPVLLDTATDELIVGHIPLIFSVVSKDAEPAGERAQHRIGKESKFGRGHGFIDPAEPQPQLPAISPIRRKRS